MTKADLFTTAGEYVCTALVPKILEWPNYLLWGVRSFQLQTVGKTGERTKYHETNVAESVLTVTSWEFRDEEGA